MGCVVRVTQNQVKLVSEYVWPGRLTKGFNNNCLCVSICPGLCLNSSNPLTWASH